MFRDGENIMLKFSAPMLYTKQDIDDLAKFNDTLTKAKIVTLYDCLPPNVDGQAGLEQNRGHNPLLKTSQDFFDLVKFAIDKGFNFVYLLNGTRAINSNPNAIESVLSNLDSLVKRLRDVGCNSFRVGNTATIQYLLEEYPGIDIRTSTTLGYTNIHQYRNLLKSYPQISEFCLHYDINHDFKLLKNLVQTLPNVQKELMVNELCIKGCPYRNSHYNFISPRFSMFEVYMHGRCFKEQCGAIAKSDFWQWICYSNIIYPWAINEYVNLGIENYKIAGRNYFPGRNFQSFYYDYLKAVEDEDFMMNMNFFSLLQNQSYISVNTNAVRKLKVKDVIDYLPNINWFKEHGNECTSVCGLDCKYCVEKARILKEKFPID